MPASTEIAPRTGPSPGCAFRCEKNPKQKARRAILPLIRGSIAPHDLLIATNRVLVIDDQAPNFGKPTLTAALASASLLPFPPLTNSAAEPRRLDPLRYTEPHWFKPHWLQSVVALDIERSGASIFMIFVH